MGLVEQGMKNTSYQKTGMRLALVVAIMYSAIYVVLRCRGDIVAIEEHSSRESHMCIMPADSNIIRGQLFNPSLTEQEVSKLAESERTRKLLLQILFGPAMCLESLVRQPASET